MVGNWRTMNDALHERMNAMLDLLVAAGTDTVENSMLERKKSVVALISPRFYLYWTIPNLLIRTLRS